MVTWAPLTVGSTYCATLPATYTFASVLPYSTFTRLSVTVVLSTVIALTLPSVKVLPIMVSVVPLV